MNSLQLINFNAIDCAYPIDYAEIYANSFEYKIEGGVVFRILDGVVINICYSSDIICGLMNSRASDIKKIKCQDDFQSILDIENDDVFVVISSRDSHAGLMSANIYKHQPVGRGLNKCGDFNAPVARGSLSSVDKLMAFDIDLIVENSFYYSKFDCVYFLLNDDEIQYVGETKDVANRFSQHIKNGVIKFNAVSVLCCYDEKCRKIIEDFYIHKFKPTMQGRQINGELFAVKNIEIALKNSNLDAITLERYLEDFRSWH
jgi:hypothetical protein